MSDLVPLPAPRATRYGRMRGAPFAGDAALPARSEVVIIGGGICGIATAYDLARRGIPVVVCEKAEIACESSSRAFGWVSELMLDPVKVALTEASKALWTQIQRDEGEMGWRQDGIAMLADAEEELALYEQWRQSVAGIGDAGTRLLSAAQVADRYPTARRGFAGALYAPSDGSIEPVIATAYLAEAARRAGARIVTDCAVRGLDLRGGRVAGVHTERGDIAAGSVLCAANAWSRLFCGNHGIDVPQLYVVMSMGRTAPIDGPVGGPVGAGGQMSWAWRRQIDGAYTLGGVTGVEAPLTRDALSQYRRFRPLMKEQPFTPRVRFGRTSWDDLRLPRRWDPRGRSPFERVRVLATEARDDVAAGSLQANAAVFAEMARGGVAETWAGAVTLTPDDTPIAGPVDAIPGFHLMTGCSYGMSWAPALGRMTADLITGASPAIDPHPFRLSRFFDGSALAVAAH